MAAREKVPSGRWIGAGTRQSGKLWVATFANEGADKLADYIRTLRAEYSRMVADARYSKEEVEDVVFVGKHAVKVYNRHFGAI